jgi:hypothetical protein
MLLFSSDISRLATSTDVERVFSKGRLLLSHIRNRLSAQSTRAVLCLSYWSLMGLVQDSDVLAVTAQPDDGKEEPGAEADGWDALLDNTEAIYVD